MPKSSAFEGEVIIKLYAVHTMNNFKSDNGIVMCSCREARSIQACGKDQSKNGTSVDVVYPNWFHWFHWFNWFNWFLACQCLCPDAVTRQGWRTPVENEPGLCRLSS